MPTKHIVENDYVLYASMEAMEDMELYVNVKLLAGWEFVCRPFVAKVVPVEIGDDEQVKLMPVLWSVVMHKKENDNV